MRVLIVDDDAVIRKFLEMILSPYGDCDQAEDGQEAVDAFQLGWEEKKPYDLISLDIMMPNKDGHEALKEIRSIEKTMGISDEDGVSVIMVTALSDVRHVIEAYHRGNASSYLVKPIDKGKLLQEIRDLGLIN